MREHHLPPLEVPFILIMREFVLPVEPSDLKDKHQSRRSFLSKLGLGAVVAAVASLPIAGRGFSKASAAGDSIPDFPEEDSIFHPAQDPRLDPRRNQSS